MDEGGENRLIEGRKEDHVDICLKEDVKVHYNYWDDVNIIHNALPEIDFSEIDTSTRLLGKDLSAPIIISAITGGYPQAENINRNLAIAAGKLGIGMGVGSQRAALEDSSLAGTYSVVKQYDIPLVIVNIGAPQLILQQDSMALDTGKIEEAFEMVDADVLAIHLNFLQEVVQPEGNVNARGCLAAMKALAFKYPIIAKETGSGISRSTAKIFRRIGVKGIDVGGSGGTSFSAVEVYRARDKGEKIRERLGRTFWDWGVPTPVSVVEANVGLDVIATGGIRNGMDVARAVVLGASSAGIAGALLKAATQSSDEVIEELNAIIQELKVTMFLTGAGNLDELRGKEVVITGKTRDWIEQLSER
ncbi:MAG: type 2 isopentenyl-diphosphate Delta-isomerase [Thermoplasmata archaeon]|nr:MAG: type 2 isopentenyl-diphosphate Delta-isomerase [Thermoplasmata archaeon]